jgi:hypothetical protein
MPFFEIFTLYLFRFVWPDIIMITHQLSGEFVGMSPEQFWLLRATMAKFGFGNRIIWTIGNVSLFYAEMAKEGKFCLLTSQQRLNRPQKYSLSHQNFWLSKFSSRNKYIFGVKKSLSFFHVSKVKQRK